MVRSIVCCLLLFSLTLISKGQISEGGKPCSFGLTGLKSTSLIPVMNLKKLDTEKLTGEEISNPGPYRYGVFTDTVIDIKVFGKKDIISKKGSIWRLRIGSVDAKSIQIIFKTFVLPDGAKLFLYNDSHSLLAGAFTKKNMHRDSSFVVADFKGNHVIVEYFEPDTPEYSGKVIIGSISQAYKDILTSMAADDFINVNCPIGKNAQLPKHAVSKMSFRSEGYSALCSGALINNVKQDGKPYFLTAHHCISLPDEASTLITYFNYENAGCDGEILTPFTLSGSELLSTSSPSDYTLLLLSETPTAEYQPFYAGWDARDTVTHRVTAIHHPQGYTKKISIDYDTIVANPIAVTWDNNAESPALSHWIVRFDEGKTDQGSSGSPLFNRYNQIIGQLHGGSENFELYGRLSYSFSNKPSSFPAITHYLDPDTTGVKELGGYSPATNIPDAFFATRFNPVCVNAPVIFKDYSVFGPYKRKWSVNPPENYSFAEGTSDTSANPVIVFSEVQDFVIKLDLLLADTVASAEIYSVLADSALNVSAKTKSGEVLCDCDFSAIELSASGAMNYSWSLASEDENKVSLNTSIGDTVHLSRVTGLKADSSYTLDLVLVGTQGGCSDTAMLSFDIIKPTNDEIARAILLNYGRSDFYSNVCASVEEGEPVPPFTSCTSQDSWCDEYGTGEDIVENSVWFRFVASATGLVSISSNGFDNQIALYEADSYMNILSNIYTILGANDDRTTSDYRPLIKSEILIPGQTYWIQVDGSGGGLEDDFYLNITELTPAGVDDQLSGSMVVYPQPAVDKVTIKTAEVTRSVVHLSVFSVSGLCVFDKEVPVNHDEIALSISSWDSGVYIVRMDADKRTYFGRIVKY